MVSFNCPNAGKQTSAERRLQHESASKKARRGHVALKDAKKITSEEDEIKPRPRERASEHQRCCRQGQKTKLESGSLQPTTSITRERRISFLCRESNKAVLFKRIKCLIVRLGLTAVCASPLPSSAGGTVSPFGIINSEYCSPRSSRGNSWLKYEVFWTLDLKTSSIWCRSCC